MLSTTFYYIPYNFTTKHNRAFYYYYIAKSNAISMQIKEFYWIGQLCYV